MQLPVDAHALQTSDRYAFRPQFTSWSRTPETRPVAQLKIREKSRS